MCRTTSRACPAGTDDTSLTNGVIVGWPDSLRCATSVTLPPAGRSAFAESTGEPEPSARVRGEQRDLVGAGRQLQRALAGAGREVVDRALAVDVHVDRGVRDAVHDVDGAGLLGLRGGRGDEGEGEGAADGEAGVSSQVIQSHRNSC